MLKLAHQQQISLLFAYCALAMARPGYLPGHGLHFDYPVLHHHTEPLHVAKVVHVPAAISHQSSTIVHTVPHHIIKPIVLPIVKTLVQPIRKSYLSAPIINTYHPYDSFYHQLHHQPHHFDHYDFHHY